MGPKYISLLLLFSFTVDAVEVGGHTFPGNVKLGAQALVLNGAGLRTATIFKAKVYAAALYLTVKSQREDEILASPSPKVLKMIFLRAIEAKDIGQAWDNSFQENCDPGECAHYAEPITKLKSLMPTVKEGDEMVYEFSDGKSRVYFNGQLKGEILGKPFATRLLSTWIGKAPPTETLKQALLSQP